MTPFQPGVFVRGAALGFVLPLAAVAWPVWRGVRVSPIDAIRVGFRSARGGGLAPLAERLRLPGGSPAQLPLRNLLRAPRRTAMTMLGIASVIAVLVGLLGMIDSFLATVDISERQAAGSTPSRLNVRLDTFHAVNSPVVERVRRTPGVAATQTGAAVSGRVSYRGHGFPVSLELVDPRGKLWAPESSEGELRPGRAGVMLTREAARDLGARVGDQITLRMPRRRGATQFAALGVRMPVVALNPNPFRTFGYLDRSQAARLGLAGQTNQLAVLPESGRRQGDLRRALFAIPGVVSAEGVTDNAKLLDKRLDDFVGVLRVVQAITLALALLIAFNSAAISLEERRREYATMFSFGMTVGRVVRLSVIEGALAGIVATGAGIGLGVAVVGWVVHGVAPETFPELGVPVALSGSTVATAALLGIAAVSLAPLLSARKLRHMDVPSALRIVE